MLSVPIVRLDPDLALPSYAHAGDAGLDLCAREDGVVTSAGVSAGIDMAFTLVERLCGRDVADETAHYIEYPRCHDVSKYQNAV